MLYSFERETQAAPKSFGFGAAFSMQNGVLGQARGGVTCALS
jgi:hypothetical protein